MFLAACADVVRFELTGGFVVFLGAFWDYCRHTVDKMEILHTWNKFHVCAGMER